MMLLGTLGGRHTIRALTVNIGKYVDLINVCCMLTSDDSGEIKMTAKKIIGILLTIIGGLGSFMFALTLPHFHDEFQIKKQLLINSEDETKLALITYGVPIGLSVIAIIILIVGIKLIRNAKKR